MNTDRLFEFQTLARTLHYGRAAEKLFITQSVLSRHIQDMERELGAQLFIRGPHGVVLTQAGAYLYHELAGFLRQVDEAADKTRTANTDNFGAVRFACLLSTMSATVQNYLKRFISAYPDILLTAEVIDDVSDKRYLQDFHYIAVSSSAIELPKEFQLMKKFQEKSYLVLPDGKPAVSGTAMPLASLAGETLFVPGYSGVLGSYAQILQLAERLTGNRVRVVRVKNPETAILNANLGLGYTVIPRHRVNELSQGVQYTSISDAECYFEMLLYRNETIANAPAPQLFGNEFCEMIQL